MTEQYHIGAYWGIRKESKEDCALRAIEFLQTLAECHPYFVNWYQGAATRKEAHKHALSIDKATLLRMFRIDEEVPEELGVPEDFGYRASVWAGGVEGTYARLSMRCGLCQPYAGSNVCSLSLPDEGELTQPILDVSTLICILKSMVFAWEPEWATVESYDHRNKVRMKRKSSIRVGWITYLARNHKSIPSLPKPAYVVPINRIGTFIILTDEVFTANNSTHLKIFSEVNSILHQSNLLSVG